MIDEMIFFLLVPYAKILVKLFNNQEALRSRLKKSFSPRVFRF